MLKRKLASYMLYFFDRTKKNKIKSKQKSEIHCGRKIQFDINPGNSGNEINAIYLSEMKKI